MFTNEYRFYPKQYDEVFLEEFIDDIGWFLSSLYKCGLILSNGQNTVNFQTHLACRVITPEKVSLNMDNFNKYSHKHFSVLFEKSSKPPEVDYIGENCDAEDSCTCENTSHYILFTELTSNVSPILCGDCMAPVPLYRFPKTSGDDEYTDILSWQSIYQACDSQYINGIGERHGYKMMNDPKSPLSTEALRICKFLEERTGKPFYYFLFKYYSKNKQTCPICGGNWANPDLNKVNYEYVCHPCRLVSNNISWLVNNCYIHDTTTPTVNPASCHRVLWPPFAFKSWGTISPVVT